MSWFLSTEGNSFRFQIPSALNTCPSSTSEVTCSITEIEIIAAGYGGAFAWKMESATGPHSSSLKVWARRSGSSERWGHSKIRRFIQTLPYKLRHNAFNLWHQRHHQLQNATAPQSKTCVKVLLSRSRKTNNQTKWHQHQNNSRVLWSTPARNGATLLKEKYDKLHWMFKIILV